MSTTQARADFRALMTEVASRSKVAEWLKELLTTHKTASAEELRVIAYGGEKGRDQ